MVVDIVNDNSYNLLPTKMYKIVKRRKVGGGEVLNQTLSSLTP